MNNIKMLQGLCGIANVIVLTEDDRKYILANEETRNCGVLEAIKRVHVVACTHDSSFRSPAGPITETRGSEVVFPPVPFPEIEGENVVSSSPGYSIDSYLRRKMSLRKEMPNIEKDDATLIIGWD